MKKKVIVPIIMSCVMAISAGLTGCGSASADPIENEYVRVKQYKGLVVPIVEKKEVTDEDVESSIKTTLESYKSYDKVDREAKDGDQVNIDFVGKVGKKAFDGGSAEGYDLVLGSNSFIGASGDYKGFEEQIVGHKAGEKFDIEVQFPETYQSEELAGKAATFTITLNEVKEVVEAELNDELVGKISTESKTVDEYRKEVKKQLEESAQSEYDTTLKQNVATELMANIEKVGDLDSEIDTYYDSLYKSYENQATMYGMDIDTFVSYYGMTLDAFKENIKKEAERGILFKYGCLLIAEKANLGLSDAEFKEKATEMAKEYGYTDQTAESSSEATTAAEEATTAAEGSTATTEAPKTALEQFIAQYGEEDIRNYLTQNNVMDYLVKNCKQSADATTATEASEETTESAAEATTEAAAESTTEAK